MPSVDVRTIDRGTYSAATTYSYGDLVTYNGTQYVFTAYTPAAGATPPAGNWTTAQTIAGATTITPQFGIDSVTTLPAGSNATAALTGTAANPTLALGIPRGIAAQATGVSVGADNRITLTFADGSSYTTSNGIAQGTAVRGLWTSGVSYIAGDSVGYNNGFYQAISANDGSATTILSQSLTTNYAGLSLVSGSPTPSVTSSGLTFPSDGGLAATTVPGYTTPAGLQLKSRIARTNTTGFSMMFLGAPLRAYNGATPNTGLASIMFRTTGAAWEAYYYIGSSATSLGSGNLGTSFNGTYADFALTVSSDLKLTITHVNAAGTSATLLNAVQLPIGLVWGTGQAATIFSQSASGVDTWSQYALTTVAGTFPFGLWRTLEPPPPVVGAWTAISLTNGTAATPPPMYRINGDVVEFRGAFTGIAAPAQSSSSTVTTMPFGFRPPGQVLCAIGTGQAGTSNMIVESTGVMYIYQASAGSTGTNYRLDGLRYSITP